VNDQQPFSQSSVRGGRVAPLELEDAAVAIAPYGAPPATRSPVLGALILNHGTWDFRCVQLKLLEATRRSLRGAGVQSIFRVHERLAESAR